jgi:hypothetical protein
MTDFQIVTVADKWPIQDYYLHEQFMESARRFGHEPLVLGWGEAFKGLGTKPTVFKKGFDDGRVKGTYILFCDAFDVIFANDPAFTVAEVMKFLALCGQRMLWNAEKDLFPSIYEDIREGHPKSPTSWKFLNSGLAIGERDAFYQGLEEMDADNLPEDTLDPAVGWKHYEDQSLWQRRLVEGKCGMMLDVQCQFFQTLSNTKLEEFDFSGPHIKNIETGMFPHIFHANGGGKTGPIIKPLLEKLKIQKL